MRRCAIVGFGCAGYHAAEELRRRDPQAEIAVYSDHSLAPYNPMLTTYYAAGRIPFDAAFPFGSLPEIGMRLRLNLRPNCRVARVDGKNRRLLLEGGESEAFDSILLSTGARAFAPPIEGLPKDRTFLMRTMDDAQALRARLSQGDLKRVLVVGASMVGIKVVELCRAAGLEVLLADMAGRIFPLSTYPEVAKAIEGRLTAQGVELRFGCAMDGARETGTGLLCHMTDGSETPADIVVLCIGTRANTALVDPAEISLGRGITVNSRMETSCPGVYAAGDCCEGTDLQSGQNLIIGLWANAGHQGVTAGANMAGGEERFDGNILHNITHFMNMDFVGMGDNRRGGRDCILGTPDKGLYIHAVMDGDELAGVNILDSYRVSGAVKNYFYRMLKGKGHALEDVQRGVLLKEGLTPSFIRQLEGRT